MDSRLVEQCKSLKIRTSFRILISNTRTLRVFIFTIVSKTVNHLPTIFI